MYDAVFVLVEAFNKLLKKKPDQFRTYTMRRSSSQHSYTNSSYGNLIANGQQNMRVLDCNIAKGWINPWEHGDKISRYLRKVRKITHDDSLRIFVLFFNQTELSHHFTHTKPFIRYAHRTSHTAHISQPSIIRKRLP